MKKIPNRKAFRGERTLNDAIRNAARHLEWLAPRLSKRGFVNTATECDTFAANLRNVADTHERHVTARIKK